MGSGGQAPCSTPPKGKSTLHPIPTGQDWSPDLNFIRTTMTVARGRVTSEGEGGI